MPERERRIQRIAVGFAVAALVTAGVAVLVVATRHSDRAPGSRVATGGRHVAVGDLVKLRPSAVEQASDGVRVADAALCKALGLVRGDTILAISGRRVARAHELRAVLRGLAVWGPRSVFVELVRDREPVLERWELDGDLGSAWRAEQADLGRGVPGVPPAVPLDQLIATVKKLDDATYEVPHSTFEAWIADPAAIGSGGQGVPASNFGQPDGFELYAIQPGSVYAALGLQSGDTIRAINGSAIASVDQVLELVAKSTTRITLDIRRRGQPLILNYLIK